MEKQKVWNSENSFREEKDIVFTFFDSKTFYKLLVIKAE